MFGSTILNRRLNTNVNAKNSFIMKYLLSFIGGAIIGASAAILFTPQKGEDVREKIKETLRKKGIIKCDCSENEIIEQIVAELQEEL